MTGRDVRGVTHHVTSEGVRHGKSKHHAPCGASVTLTPNGPPITCDECAGRLELADGTYRTGEEGDR